VHVQDVSRSAAFVKIVDILGHQQQFPVELALEPSQRPMRGVWLDLGQGRAAHVVEGKNAVRIAGEPLGRGHILNSVLFPQPAGIAKRINSTFSRYAGSCQDDDGREFCHDRHFKQADGGVAMANFGIVGHEGRMGRAIIAALADTTHDYGAGADAGGDIDAVARQCDVLVDFSAPGALEATLAAAEAARTPVLIGTTGLEPSHFEAIERAAGTIALIQTGNTSLGITLLAHLVREAAARLGPDWDVEVLEMHHRHKVDAPSGTAKLLGEAAAEARGIALAENSESGRDGHSGARAKGAIGFAALRGGTVAGDHSVIFAGTEESLTLSHSAQDRTIFARGAVQGAQWLIGKSPGRYTMNDVLGI